MILHRLREQLGRSGTLVRRAPGSATVRHSEGVESLSEFPPEPASFDLGNSGEGTVLPFTLDFLSLFFPV